MRRKHRRGGNSVGNLGIGGGILAFALLRATDLPVRLLAIIGAALGVILAAQRNIHGGRCWPVSRPVSSSSATPAGHAQCGAPFSVVTTQSQSQKGPRSLKIRVRTAVSRVVRQQRSVIVVLNIPD